MAKKYEYEGKVYTTMMDIARAIGKVRVRPSDFAKLGITVVEDTQVEQVDETPKVAQDDPSAVDDTTSQIIFCHLGKDGIIADEVIDIPHVVGESEKETRDMETTTYTTVTTYTTATTYSTVTTYTTSAQVKTGTPEDIAEVEMAVVDMTRDELGAAIKHFTMDALRQMAVNAGIEKLYEDLDPRIRKMRLIMAIKEAYFPTIKYSKKNKPRPWRGVPLEECLKRAKEYGVTWKTDPCPKINRMRLVIALKKNHVPSPKDEVQAEVSA